MNDPTGAAAAPAVTGVIPATGGTAGGTPVTVNGSGFTGATAVNFDGAGAIGVQVLSDTQLTAVSPAGSGLVDVTVVTPAGTSATGPADQFTYIALVAQVAPSSVARNSSTTYLQPKTVLTLSVYNPSGADADMTNSGLRIEFGVDPGGSGSAGALIASQYTAGLQTSGSPQVLRSVDAAVIGDSGWSIKPVPDAPCAFLAIPGTGPGQGTIAATGSVTFTFAVDVDLAPGSAPVAISVVGVNSPATVPNNPPLLILKTEPVLDILSFTSSPGQLNPPSNWSVLTWDTVGAGQCQLTWTESTTNVAYQGKYLSPGGTVPFQTNALEPIVATLQATDTFTLTAVGATPTPKTHEILTSDPLLQSSLGTDPLATPCVPFELSWTCFNGSGPVFNWNVDSGMEVTVQLVTHPATVVTGIAPDTGTAAGGTTVVITGKGFTGASAVSFGPVSAAMNIDSDTKITAISPPGAGPVDVTVTTPGGTSAASTADRFTCTTGAVPAPVVTAISPDTGTATGGTTVVITGRGFTGASAVSFGPLTASITPGGSDTQIIVVSPPGAGPVDVTVTAPGGISTASTADQFTYTTAAVPAPVVTGISPATGTATGGVPVVITGSGFTGVIAVHFGPLTASITPGGSDTQITAVSPPGAGTVDLTVTTPGGTSVTSTADQFTYTPAATNYPPTTINTGDLIPDTGTANVTLTPQPDSGQTTFSISIGGVERVNAIVNVNPVSLSASDPLAAGLPWIDRTGRQWVTLTWSAQNATGFTIARNGITISPKLAYNASEYTAPLSNPAQTATFTITAMGYVTSDSITTQSVVVSPVVQILGFTASPTKIVLGQQATLSWNVIAFTSVSVYEEGPPQTAIGTTPGATSVKVKPTSSMTYGIIAHGSAGQTAGPVLAPVTVIKPPKEKDKEKEKDDKDKDGLEKQAKDHEVPTPPNVSPGSGDAPDAGLPSGSQQAFIGPDERPDVGARLRDDEPGA